MLSFETWLLLTSWATDELVLVEHILHFVVFLCNDLILSFEYFKLGIKLVIGSVEVNDSSFKHFPDWLVIIAQWICVRILQPRV